jgi:hypothetical protein
MDVKKVYVVVPHAGVEPALLSELDFESSASTNSANGAQGSAISAARIYTKDFAVVNHHFQDARPTITKACGPLTAAAIYSAHDPA